MKKEILEHSGYQVKRGKIVRTKPLSQSEKLFEIVLPDGQILDHEPGQFVMLSLFSIGEAPISICSSPTRRGSFEVCVRAVGKFTKALHTLEPGDEVGVRGPYGTGFPVTYLKGNDILIIAGGLGIAPLRSLITYITDVRRDFGKVNILLGSKSPKSMIFGDEIDQWQERMDINFSSTVDVTDSEWDGHVGLITSLIPGVTLDPIRTYAVVVGPPVMYRFVVRELFKKKIPEKQVYMSFERHMKCGLGKCGHCQIHNIYTCQDGPVFSFELIRNLPGSFNITELANF